MIQFKESSECRHSVSELLLRLRFLFSKLDRPLLLMQTRYTAQVIFLKQIADEIEGIYARIEGIIIFLNQIRAKIEGIKGHKKLYSGEIILETRHRSSKLNAHKNLYSGELILQTNMTPQN